MNRRDKWLKILWLGILLVLLGVIFYCMGVTIKARRDNVASKTSEPSTQNYGEYYLFETTKSQEYLEFLEKLDEEEYEIIDISTSLKVHIDGSDEFYMVTYKKIT